MKVRIFTDGACSGNPGPGGWACVVMRGNDIVKMSGYKPQTTNNEMELYALYRAIKYVCESYTRDYDSVEILSDSAYCINALRQGWLHKWSINQWKKSDGTLISNQQIWEKLYSCLNVESKPIEGAWCMYYKLDELPIIFTKVKGHSGNTFNEMADELARQEIIKNR